MKMMKYIVCEEPGVFLVKEKEVPERKCGEVLLKINKVGICGTDLHAYSGNQPFFKYPRILGHELAAEVLEADDASRFKPNDKVVIMPYLSCGKCRACRKSKSNCCEKIKVFGVHIDGGMQDKVVLPESVLLQTSNLYDEEMAIVEPLAIGAHAIRRANVKEKETVVVIGCGPIGIGIIKLAQLKKARVIALDTNEDRLMYVKNEMKVKEIIKAGSSAHEKVEKITNEEMADHVFDATGNKNALESGIKYMAHGGKYILVGLSKGDLNFNHPEIHAKETTLLCSRNALIEDFRDVIELLEKGYFPTNSYITHRVGADQMIQDFKSWTRNEPGMIKAILNFDFS